MKEQLRVISFNLCEESSETSLIKLLKTFQYFKPDIVFLQEIKKYDLEILNMEIFQINYFEETAILINQERLKKIDDQRVKLRKWFGKKIFLGGLHLHNIPSIMHYLHNIEYDFVPTNLSWYEILNMAKQNRLPNVQEMLKKAKKTDFAIIAGDFNEPSHLEYPLMNLPVSKEFYDANYIDTYFEYHKSKQEFKYISSNYTWPVGNFYDNEPQQCIDFIYSRNLPVISSFTYDTNIHKQFLTDHRMVISDIEI
jgi:mRNA deadenylase 3'-5' endonuclease subunit Ccr4